MEFDISIYFQFSNDIWVSVIFFLDFIAGNQLVATL